MGYEEWYESQDLEECIHSFLIENSERFIDLMWDSFMDGNPVHTGEFIELIKDSSGQWGKDFDHYMDREYTFYLSNEIDQGDERC